MFFVVSIKAHERTKVRRATSNRTIQGANECTAIAYTQCLLHKEKILIMSDWCSKCIPPDIWLKKKTPHEVSTPVFIWYTGKLTLLPASFSLIFQHVPWAPLSPRLSFLIFHPFISSIPLPPVSQAAAPLCSYLTAVLHRFALPSADFYLVRPPPPSHFVLPLFPLAFLRCQTQHQTALMFSSMNRLSPPRLSLRSIQLWKTHTHTSMRKHKLACMLPNRHTHVHARRLAAPLLSGNNKYWRKQWKKKRKKWGSPIIPKSLSLATQTYTREKKGSEQALCVSFCVCVCRD